MTSSDEFSEDEDDNPVVEQRFVNLSYLIFLLKPVPIFSSYAYFCLDLCII